MQGSTAPQGRGGAPGGAAAPAAAETKSEKLGDGVYLITGGYAVVAVDFRDYVAIVESGEVNLWSGWPPSKPAVAGGDAPR